jgi:hypothetical protein
MPSIPEALELLRPTSKPNVMDLLREAGHDVDYWKVNQDGSAVEKPAANPNYCYDWSFGSHVDGIVLCVWHGLLRVNGDRIVYLEPMRTLCEGLYEVAASSARTPKERDRARQQAVRARAFYGLVQQAYEQLLQIRMIVNEGDMRSRSELGIDSSRVHRRMLDCEPWYVHEYDEKTGAGLIVRGLKPARDQIDSYGHQGGDEGTGPEDSRQFSAILIRRGQRDFRDRLLGAWTRRCVVTECRVEGLLEASHIVPHAEVTDYRTSNGLLLRADIHTLYDLNLLSIDEHLRVHLAPELLASEYKQYEGKRIQRRPEKLSDAPSAEALRRRYQEFLEERTKSSLC